MLTEMLTELDTVFWVVLAIWAAKLKLRHYQLLRLLPPKILEPCGR
jgi:hypothetical protein